MNLYFIDSGDSNFANLDNWWEDSAGTIPASALPTTGDVAYFQTGQCTMGIPSTIDFEVVIQADFSVTSPVGTSFTENVTVDGAGAALIAYTPPSFASGKTVSVINGGYLALVVSVDVDCDIYSDLVVGASSTFATNGSKTTHLRGDCTFEANATIQFAGPTKLYGATTSSTHMTVNGVACSLEDGAVVSSPVFAISGGTLTVKSGSSLTLPASSTSTCLLAANIIIDAGAVFIQGSYASLSLDDGSELQVSGSHEMGASSSIIAASGSTINYAPTSLTTDPTVSVAATGTLNVDASFDINFFLSVEAGGAFTFSSGKTLTGLAGGKLYLNGDADISGSIVVEEDFDFRAYGAVNIPGSIQFESGSVPSIDLGGSITVTGSMTIDAGAELDVIEGMLKIRGELVWNGDINVQTNGDLGFGGLCIVSGNGTLNHAGGDFDLSSIVAGTNVTFPTGGGGNILGPFLA